MGILDKVKKVFDKGGVKVSIDLPETFHWSDDVLPVAVQLKGSDEERVVTHLELTLTEDLLLGDKPKDETPSERARRERQVKGSAVTYTHQGPITLAAGTEQVVSIDFPLSIKGAAEATGLSDEVDSTLLGAASTAMNLVSEATRNQEWYRMQVAAKVEGYSASASASQKIRNLRTGETKRGIWTHRWG
jgi:hypothetical protein